MYEDLDINTTDNAMIPFREFVDAYYDCRRTKRRKQSATEFEMDWESNIYKLYDEVNAKTYEIGKSITFVTTRPKKARGVRSLVPCPRGASPRMPKDRAIV